LITGNTTTGVVGLATAHGKVVTASGSLQRAVSGKASVGIEASAAFANDVASDRAELQALLGGIYYLREGLSFDLGAIVGRFTASPRVGVQLGLSWDLPHRVSVASMR
jgi:hypothetical protein